MHKEIHVHCHDHDNDHCHCCDYLADINQQLTRIADLMESFAGANIQPLIDKLKTSGDALQAATDANQPK